MRELLPFVLLVCACGAELREPARGAAGSTTATATPSSGAAQAQGTASAATASGPAFDALAARAAELAPGMREVARKETGGEPVELVRATGADVCVRVAFEASTAVRARLLDEQGAELAATPAPAAAGVLGERGPVCVRRGEAVKAVADAGDAGGLTKPVRWMAWEAP